jgi:hypothetical protein
MVRARLQYYYTFKIASGDDEALKVECHKWEEETGDHSGTIYTVKPGVVYMGCSCPAYRKCKHQTCVQEAIDTGKIGELHKWKWSEKRGWERVEDIPELEEIQL